MARCRTEQPAGRPHAPFRLPVEIETIERGNLASGDDRRPACSILSSRQGSSCRSGTSGRCAGPGCCASSGRPRIDRSSRSSRLPATASRASSSSGRRKHSGPVAWLTADDTDSDPVVFLTDLAAAIDRCVSVGAELFGAIAADTVSHRTVVGRLLAVMSRPTERVRLAIDDAHRITSRACLDILAEFVEHMPEGSQVAIAGAPGCASRSLAGERRAHCSRSGRRSWRWTSTRPSGWDANSGCACRPILPRA